MNEVHGVFCNALLMFQAYNEAPETKELDGEAENPGQNNLAYNDSTRF